MTARTAVALAALAAAVAAPAAAQGRAFTPQDWYKLTTLGAPAISPDGKWVAFTVTTVREAENKRHSEVWMVAADGGEPMRMTSPSLESSNPRWSPDGRLLLFSSSRPNSKARTWGLRMEGPGGEAFEVDSLPDGSWSADGSLVVWTDTAEVKRDSLKTPWDRMQPMARPPHGAITRPLDPARFDGRHITEQLYKANNRGFLPGPREARRWNAAQLWVRRHGGEKRMLTSAGYSHRGAVVSPDGRWIAFVADPALRPDSVVQAEQDSLARLPYDAKRNEAPRNDGDIFVVPVDGGAPRRLTSANGAERSLQWSPDGRSIAYVSAETRTASQRIRVVPAAGGAPRDLLGDFRYEPGGFVWPTSGELLMEASVGGRDALFRVDPARPGAVEERLGGRRRIMGLSADPAGRRVAYVATSVSRPTELFAANADGTGERQLTRFNEALNREIAWPEAERFTYESVGGLTIEAWLQRPHGYQPGRKYPLVLYIHGGPHSAYGEGWFDEFHNITGAGMWVLYTNPRGSSNYGADFTFSTRGRWGLEDYQDLMKAVDIAARRSDVDSTRMGVTGGSYGGFMTAWVTTRTGRFKAAQADRMISNWWSWYGMSDAQGLTEFEFYGKPWENPRLYDQYSPIRFVDKVTTPTLIVQSEEDHRTPMGDAEQWFMALKKRGVPVEFVRYPRSTHDLSRTGEPWLLVDRLGRLRQWFTHYLIGPAEPQQAAGRR